MHKQNMHAKIKNGPSEVEKVEKVQMKIVQSEEEIYKWSMSEFETKHDPGVKSHMTKMHGDIYMINGKSYLMHL